MLLGNYSVLNKNPSRSSGGLAFSGTIAPWDSVYSLYTHEGYLENLKYSALPTATEAPYSWILPPKSGGEMSSTTSIRGSGGLSGSLTRGGAISASMGGSGSFTSALGLLTALTSTMAGAGSLTASISASLGLASTMGGTSTLAGNLGMLVPFVANMSGIGALSANLKGMASLSATIYVNSGSATIKEIVDGVWNAQTSDYVEVGSMGEALPGGGGGGGGATAAQIWSYAERTLTESAGLTTEQAEQLTRIDGRVDKKISNISAGFIGGTRTDYGVEDRSDLKSIKKAIEKIPQVDLTKLEKTVNETKTHIDIAKNSIIDTIKSSSDSLETEICNDIKTTNKELKEGNVATRQLVMEKTKKLEENVSKLADRQEMTDKMIERESEEIESEIERILREEADMIENEIDTQLNNEADEIESQLNQETNGNT